jgi:SAM-dependent methyltransferase
MAATSDQIKAYFDTDAYVRRNPIISVRAQLLSEMLRATRDSRIIDLGCGDGTLTRPLLRDGNRLTLVDFSGPMLDRARAHFPSDAPVEFVESDVLSYHSIEPADVVVCIGVLAHVSSPEAVIAHIAGLMRPNGICVLEITDRSSPMGWLLTQKGRLGHRAGWATNRLSRSELVQIARAHRLAELPSTLRRYGLLVPIARWLPYGTALRLEEAAARRPRIAGVTAQILLGFRLLAD